MSVLDSLIAQKTKKKSAGKMCQYQLNILRHWKGLKMKFNYMTWKLKISFNSHLFSTDIEVKRTCTSKKFKKWRMTVLQTILLIFWMQWLHSIRNLLLKVSISLSLEHCNQRVPKWWEKKIHSTNQLTKVIWKVWQVIKMCLLMQKLEKVNMANWVSKWPIKFQTWQEDVSFSNQNQRFSMKLRLTQDKTHHWAIELKMLNQLALVDVKYLKFLNRTRAQIVKQMKLTLVLIQIMEDQLNLVNKHWKSGTLLNLVEIIRGLIRLCYLSNILPSIWTDSKSTSLNLQKMKIIIY